jgi:putative hemolysin
VFISDSMEIHLLFLFLLTLLLSSLFSGSEIAFIVANRLKIEVRARKNVRGAKTTLSFTRQPERYFSTLLVGNNIANVACSSVATALFSLTFGWSEFTILLVVSFSLLLFGEVIPKTIARDAADYVVILFALFILVVRAVLYPLVWISEKSSDMLLKLFRIQPGEVRHFFSRSDINQLIRESSESGEVDSEDGTMLIKAMSLADQPVREVMIPRTEFVAVEHSATIQEVIRMFRRTGLSRLPVFKDTLDHIIGVVYAHDLFQRPRSIKNIVREVLFVPETKKSADMLREFRQRGITIAIVIDEYGGTAGLVTTEDLIEELVGEIHDEYDMEEVVCEKKSNSLYILSGRVEIDYLNEVYGLSVPSGDYETVSGFVMQAAGSIPSAGDVIRAGDYTIKVTKTAKNIVQLVELEVNQKTES